MRPVFLGAHAPSRAGCGALAATNFQGNGLGVAGRRKVRDDEGVIASTRGRVRSPDQTFARRPLYEFVIQSTSLLRHQLGRPRLNRHFSVARAIGNLAEQRNRLWYGFIPHG